ncbi:hypothetical protein [Mucisphaera sp.]|uniref:hypothetical protein n=1 Tax=Mucisphaera sp. TaxID=2913024 RepID=UPI003D09788B
MQTLILIPSHAEAAPTVRKLHLQRDAPARWTGQHLTLSVVGIGPQAANNLPETSPDTRCLIAGLAAATNPRLRTKTTHFPTTVRDDQGLEPIELATPATQTDNLCLMSTQTPIASAQAKATLHTEHHIDLIDMETHAIARTLPPSTKPTALRVISDDAATSLPPGIEHWLTPQGRTRPTAILSSLLRHPYHLAETARFMRHAQHATHLLAQAIENWLDDSD